MEVNEATTKSLLTTNGMFIIDEIYTQDGQVYKDVPGGGGMFAMLGGCIVSPTARISEGLKWIVDCGNDFPSNLLKIIESWGSSVVFRHDSSRKTTRGWNFYRDNDFREFKYLTPKKQVDVEDWCHSFGKEELQKMKCLHLLCSSKRCVTIIEQLESIGCHNEAYVWEPIPDLCNAENYHEIKGIMQREKGPTLIFSPNAEEGARIFGDKEPLTLEECIDYVWKFDNFIADQNICVLRCGKLGSITLSERNNKSGKRTVVHLPAYHFLSPQNVVDPTGAGNSFLGAFCVGYTLTKDLHIANICGNIASGCVIEQIGIPKLDQTERKWNGITFHQRLDYYIKTYQLNYNIERIYEQLK